MPKEKNYNPVQAQRKADKAKAAKKGKAEVQSRRNEKLARKNPERIQKQIDDLKAITTNGGKLSRHEEQLLEGLEKEVRVVKKAREALGDNAPTFSKGTFQDRGSSGPGTLGKRRRGSENASSSEDDIPQDVKEIPMPRDTPPPIPKDVLDKWYSDRRVKRQAEWEARNGGRNREAGGDDGAKKDKIPEVEARTVYEAKPMVRDLRKEAVSAFVPAAVQRKKDKGQGQGGLVEPEEADRLEREGYLKTAEGRLGGDVLEEKLPSLTVTVEDADEDEGIS